MARIAGINIPMNKHVVIGLTHIYGVGKTRARKVCAEAGVDPTTKVKDLTEAEVNSLRSQIARAGPEFHEIQNKERIPKIRRRSLDVPKREFLRLLRGGADVTPVHAELRRDIWAARGAALVSNLPVVAKNPPNWRAGGGFGPARGLRKNS